MLTTFEGSKRDVARQHRDVSAIYRRFGAVDLGPGSGKSFESSKYDFPHIRDFLMDRGVTSDVSETSTTWKNIVPLYRATTASLGAAIHESRVKPWVGCHISHTYQCGASLYLTFACKQQDGREMQPYSELLAEAIRPMVDIKEEKDLDSLFTSPRTSALVSPIAGLDDFELIAFLVVQTVA